MAAENASRHFHTVALIVAGGTGLRAGGPIPKQYQMMAGKTVLRRALEAFASHPDIDAVMPIIGRDDAARFQGTARGLPKLLPAVIGGATRQESVRNGLTALDACDPQLVLVHDAARPLVSAKVISDVIAALGEGPAVIPAIAVADTVKRVENGRVMDTVPRHDLVTAQTPQGFHFAPLLAAHRKAAKAGVDDLTDDAAVAALAGIPVRVVEGERRNIKLTIPADFGTAEMLLAAGMETRTAQGFDVHAFGSGDSICLCGVEIAHDRGLIGHSDADVGLHALTDALLGTVGDGDIGLHYPPGDPRWRGAASEIFLRDAARRLGERGGRILHLDVTLVCERPKIGPYREPMRETIARIAEIAVGRVSVKATTSEGLGFTGRGEGIAAFALATVSLPAET